MAKGRPAAEALIADGANATAWTEARKRLEKAEKYRTYWLATVLPDGRPHVVPLLGLWRDGTFYFLTGEATRRGKNLANDPHCVVTVSSTALASLDLVVEGEAVKLTDEAKLRRVVRAFVSELRWPLELREGAVFGPSAPTAGPPPYAVFELTPTTAFGLPGVTGTGNQGKSKKAPFSPTRWRF